MSIDQRNRAAYTITAAQNWYRSLDSFVDAGERAAYHEVAQQGVGGPILDLGVGGGRTVAIAQSISQDYLALDYLPEMVALCRSRHPDVAVQLGDARDLRELADDHFRIVMFSFNGLDSLDHAGRLAALAEVYRVLAPGGLFWFSTLNRDGSLYRKRPWFPSDAMATMTVVANTYRYLRTRRAVEVTDTYELAPMVGHGYRLLTHYTRLPDVELELLEAGFEASPTVFRSGDGSRVHDLSTRDLVHEGWQILASKSS